MLGALASTPRGRIKPRRVPLRGPLVLLGVLARIHSSVRRPLRAPLEALARRCALVRRETARRLVALGVVVALLLGGPLGIALRSSLVGRIPLVIRLLSVHNQAKGVLIFRVIGAAGRVINSGKVRALNYFTPTNALTALSHTAAEA